MKPAAPITLPDLTPEERAAFYPPTTRAAGKASVRVHEREER